MEDATDPRTISPYDLRIDSMRTGDEVHVKVTHLPTGEVMNVVSRIGRYLSEADVRNTAVQKLREHLDHGNLL